MTLRSRYQRSQYGRQFGRGASAYGTPGEFVSNQGATAGGMSEYLRQLIEQMQRSGSVGGGGGQGGVGGAGGASTGYVSPNAIPNYPYDPNKPWNGGVRDGRFVPRWPTADQIENTVVAQGFRFVGPTQDGKQARFVGPNGQQITLDPATGTQDPLTPGESGFNYGTTPAGAPRPTTTEQSPITGQPVTTPTPVSATGGTYAGMSSDGQIVFYRMPDGTMRQERAGVLQGAGNTAGGQLIGSGQSPQGPVQFWKMPDGSIRTTVGGQVQPTAQPAPQTPSAPPSAFMPSPAAPTGATGAVAPVVEGQQYTPPPPQTQALAQPQGAASINPAYADYFGAGGAPKFAQPQMPSATPPTPGYTQVGGATGANLPTSAETGGAPGWTDSYAGAVGTGPLQPQVPYPQYQTQPMTPQPSAPTSFDQPMPDAGMTAPPDPFMGYFDVLGMSPPPDVLEVPVVPEPFSAMTANSDSIFA